MSWAVVQIRYEYGRRHHVVPIDDLREHESDGCWCRPEDDEDGFTVHNSMDGREAFENGQRKPS